MTRVLHVDGAAPAAAALDEAVTALAPGLLLIYPTETLYALGGILSAEVARRIRAAKEREAVKPLPLVVADSDQARQLVAEWSDLAELLARRFWPGPLTLVVRAHFSVPDEVSAGTGSVAVRVPGLALPRELCRRVGPLVSTSANRSGEAPHARCAPAVEAVGAAAALALDAGPLGGVASTVVDLTGQPRLLRAGAVSLDDIARVLHPTGASLQTGSGRKETPP